MFLKKGRDIKKGEGGDKKRKAGGELKQLSALWAGTPLRTM